MRRVIKKLIDHLLGAAGFELRRKPVHHCWGASAFADQVEVLKGTDVATILDVGANLGQTTSIYRDLFPSAVIHAFEPCSSSYEGLQRAYASCPRVLPRAYAVADHCGKRHLHNNRSHYTNSLLPSAQSAHKFVGPGLMDTIGSSQVDTITIDAYCQEQDIARIDILKIDTQGAEGLVLAGAQRMLQSHAIRLIYSEVQLAPMYIGQSTLWDCQQILEQHGYRLFGIYNLAHAGREGLAWADVIYLPGEQC